MLSNQNILFKSWHRSAIKNLNDGPLILYRKGKSIFFNTPCHFLSNAKPSFWVPPSITSKLVSRGFDLCELCQQQLFRFSPIYQTFIIIIKWVCVWRQTEGGYLLMLWVLNGEGVQVRALCMCVNNNINISWLFDQFVHICMYQHGKKMH